MWFSQNIVFGTGTIKFIDLEGGFHGIVSDDGKHYDPGTLSPEFKVDGLRVRFMVELHRNVYTSHMWGTPVSILYIKKLN